MGAARRPVALSNKNSSIRQPWVVETRMAHLGVAFADASIEFGLITTYARRPPCVSERSEHYFLISKAANKSPVHTSNNVEATGNKVACCFDIVASVDRA